MEKEYITLPVRKGSRVLSKDYFLSVSEKQKSSFYSFRDFALINRVKDKYELYSKKY